MTIVIGIKVKDGAILASDCQMIRGADKIPTPKIHQALYCPEEKDSPITGIYYGSSGSHAFVDIALLSKKIFSEQPNIADLLTDDFIHSHSLDEINALADYWYQQSRTSEKSASKKARTEEERIIQYREVKSFIESGNGGAVWDLSRIVLRLSKHYSPDILHIKTSQVQLKSCVVIGNGQSLVEEKLFRQFSETASLQEALALVISAMNSALEYQDKYAGYQLVAVTRSAEGGDIIKTAENLTAHMINPAELVYLDPWFRPFFKE